MRNGEEKRLKVYCETSFWSWLVSRPSTNPDNAVKQAWTRKWWEEIAPKCEIYVSQHVGNEAMEGDPERARLRKEKLVSALELNGAIQEVTELAGLLLRFHALPEKEITDALHIATAAVYGLDVILTWNCRHMANPVTLPKTSSVIAKAGYRCPVIVTPCEYIERKEEIDHEC